MQLTVLGGAGEHGRSSYLLTEEQAHILLDYGVKKEDGGQYPVVENMEQLIGGLQTVFLSHAHEDHCIGLPILYRHGYRGEVWTTRATVQQLPAYFNAWKKYTDQRHVTRPYDDEDEQLIHYRYLEDVVTPGQWGQLQSGLDICWGRSGHLPGSIWLALKWKGKSIFFSGDYTSESQMLVADRPLHQSYKYNEAQVLQTVPIQTMHSHEQLAYTAISESKYSALTASPILPDLDLAIVDAAYGDDSESQTDKLHQIKTHIDDALQTGGSILLPVPLYGRGQELLLWASEHYSHIPLLVESVLLEGIQLLTSYRDWLYHDIQPRIERLLHHAQLYSLYDPEQTDALYTQHRSKIIFTPDGMLQTSLARRHYERLQYDPHSTMIFTGHLAKGSPGRQFVATPPLSGCRIKRIGYKVHQGLPDVEQMLNDLNRPPSVLVHAPKARTDQLASYLRQHGYRSIHSLIPTAKLDF
ncbi:MBL fold metallo-hydrolase [Paenibacillus wenxiniae]|uniref:MBL fold metallo-hydrolase n=1 Tax=Paenibacillus wenxiniae TaxID=1636843 RepID=A0ABW4RKD7_9BACL